MFNANLLSKLLVASEKQQTIPQLRLSNYEAFSMYFFFLNNAFIIFIRYCSSAFFMSTGVRSFNQMPKRLEHKENLNPTCGDEKRIISDNWNEVFLLLENFDRIDQGISLVVLLKEMVVRENPLGSGFFVSFDAPWSERSWIDLFKFVSGFFRI